MKKLTILLVVLVCALTSACATTTSQAVDVATTNCEALNQEGVSIIPEVGETFSSTVVWVIVDNTLCGCVRSRPANLKIKWDLVSMTCVPY